MEDCRYRKAAAFRAGWPGCVLSSALVASRAASSCVPMEQWSWWSWALMLAPAAWPLYAFAAWCALYALVAAPLFVAGAFARAFARARRRRH